MPARLTKAEGLVAIKLFGQSEEFNELLRRVKEIPGRRWNDADKVWEIPDEPDLVMRLVAQLQPEMDLPTQAWIREVKAEAALTLANDYPSDAQLEIPWAEYLFGFQRADVDFFANHPHSLNALEMGLGKTVESIAAVEERRLRAGTEPGRVLVIAPAKIRGAWADTLAVGPRDANGDAIIASWEPKDCVIVEGNATKRRKQLDAAGPETWVIVNWEKLRLMPELAKMPWEAVIADECHRAKNRKAKQTKALWKITAPMQLGLTGTPIINTPDDLWSILRWLRPEQYATHTAGGGYWSFFHTYVESYQTQYGPVCTGVRNPEALRFELADKMIRRTKTQELDIPEKIIETIPVELNPGQRKLYTAAEKDFWLEVEQAVEAGLELPDKDLNIESLSLMIPNGGARLTRLRQIVSTPALLGADDDSAKLDTAVELITDNQPKQFVVFCWYEGTTKFLADRLERLKPPLRVERITGKTGDPTDRVKRFQAGEIDVLVNTIAAGGSGLTLTAADTAIFVEEDWTPAMNLQAQDRLWRQGQRNAVTIINLRASGTIDVDRIVPKNTLKSLIINTVMGE